MKIENLRKELEKNRPDLDLKIKKDLAFQVALHLEEARLVKGYTQKELARKAGTKQSNIARAERGLHLPSLSFLKRIAEAFETYLIPPKFAFMEIPNVKVEIKTNSGMENNYDDSKRSGKFILQPTPFLRSDSINSQFITE